MFSILFLVDPMKRKLVFLKLIKNRLKNLVDLKLDTIFRIMRVLTDIYYGKVKHVWGVPVEDWSLVKEEQERIEEYKKSLEAQLV